MRLLCFAVLAEFGWIVVASPAQVSEQASCDLAIVGAGIGGAYAAWHAAEAGKKVCVFEMADRPGGRIHSLRGEGPKKDLIVEAGAYRFAPHEVCDPITPTAGWCIFTPITAASVKELGLRSKVYDPNPKMWDHQMHVLSNEKGEDIGYLTLVETMLNRSQMNGAQVLFKTGVTHMDGNNSGLFLHLVNGNVAHAHAVLLNIPQGPLLKILRHSGQPFTTFPAPLYVPVRKNIMKLYVHYEDAWWRNVLNLTTGAFANDNPPKNENTTIHKFKLLLEDPAPLKGQYHDGDVRCDGPDGKCRGFLQAVYDSGDIIEYYSNFHPFEGDAVVHLTHSTAEHMELLSRVHKALVKLHKPQLDAANATAQVEQMLPDSGVLSIWSESAQGINAGCHFAELVNNSSGADLTGAVVQPFPGLPVYVANEAFGTVPCFAEGSLNMSARALERLGVPRPASIAAARPGRMAPPPTDPFLLMDNHMLRKMSVIAGATEHAIVI